MRAVHLYSTHYTHKLPLEKDPVKIESFIRPITNLTHKTYSSYRVHKFDASGGVRNSLANSSFIQGCVYRDTDASNMTPCRT